MKHNLLFSLALCVAGLGCNCIEGEGPLNDKTFELSSISGLSVDGALDVRIKQGTPQSVVLTAQQNLLDLFQVNVKDGVAYINSSECYNTNKQAYIDIVIPRLDLLSLNGAGDIVGDGKFMLTELKVSLDGAGDITLDVDAAEIHAELDGAGDITLSGETKELYVSIDGAGDIDAVALHAEDVEAEIDGAGDIKVYASETLDASVDGSGDILYKGKPKLDSNISGSGSVSPL